MDRSEHQPPRALVFAEAAAYLMMVSWGKQAMVTVRQVLKHYFDNPDLAHQFGERFTLRGWTVEYKVGDASEYIIEARLGGPKASRTK